ncbi:MAK10-like protein [Tanacetum coccineum]|uniref:MAK10-like protein n=1 Tax=Tanacetum coccineum TaxID=301880 RepID=A0ABQ4Y3V4_9ASTR
MGDKNPIRTLGDYSKPSHKCYRNTIELPEGNNVVPLRSDTIRLVQNGCSFHGLRSEDPNQHLKDFLKLVDSLNLDEDLTTRFLAQFFPSERTVKLRNDILIFQQHQGEYLSEALTNLKDLLQKVPHHGINLWLQVQIFYDRINEALKKTVDYIAEGRLRKLSAKKAWVTIEKLARYEDEGWNDPVIPEEGSLDYENPDVEQLLGVMEYKLLPKPSRQEEFEHIVTNFILDQEERFKQLKEYMEVIMGDFMLLSLEVTRRLGDSKPFDTLADLGSCVNIIPLDLFKKINIGLLEETGHIFGLDDGTKSYPIGIVKDVEVHTGKLKLLNDFYVIDMKKDPETPLLVGRGFLAIANAVIDCRMAKKAVGEGITRSVFRVKGVDLGEKEAPYWTTLGKIELYKPRPLSDGIGTPTSYYARKDFLHCRLPGEWEIARDVEVNPFKDTLVFRRMVEFVGAIPVNLKSNMWESEDLIKKPINEDKPPKNGDGAWHAKIRLIEPDEEEFTKTLQSIPTTRKLSEKRKSKGNHRLGSLLRHVRTCDFESSYKTRK